MNTNHQRDSVKRMAALCTTTSLPAFVSLCVMWKDTFIMTKCSFFKIVWFDLIFDLMFVNLSLFLSLWLLVNYFSLSSNSRWISWKDGALHKIFSLYPSTHTHKHHCVCIVQKGEENISFMICIQSVCIWFTFSWEAFHREQRTEHKTMYTINKWKNMGCLLDNCLHVVCV